MYRLQLFLWLQQVKDTLYWDLNLDISKLNIFRNNIILLKMLIQAFKRSRLESNQRPCDHNEFNRNSHTLCRVSYESFLVTIAGFHIIIYNLSLS